MTSSSHTLSSLLIFTLSFSNSTFTPLLSSSPSCWLSAILHLSSFHSLHRSLWSAVLSLFAWFFFCFPKHMRAVLLDCLIMRAAWERQRGSIAFMRTFKQTSPSLLPDMTWKHPSFLHKCPRTHIWTDSYFLHAHKNTWMHEHCAEKKRCWVFVSI